MSQRKWRWNKGCRLEQGIQDRERADACKGQLLTVFFRNALRQHLREKEYEERTCWITGFRLDISCVEVTDEDGFSWLFDLGEESWELDQEFTLKLTDIPELWNDIEKVA